MSSDENLMQISVVMATYKDESATNLREAINSIIQQQLLPTEFIIVGDGPLPNDQISVIQESSLTASFPIRFLQLDKNCGRGRARNFGIENSTSDYIALMDSDDIALPQRLRTQAEFMLKNLDVDVLATLTEEFDEEFNIDHTGSIKTCPEFHLKIKKALLLSNCVANPTLLFKKCFWLKVNGFPNFKQINEDYLFYFRLIESGAVFHCVQEPLLLVRIGQQQRSRRKGLRILSHDIKFRFLAFREGHLTLFWFLFPLLLITIRRILPPYVDRLAHTFWRYLSHRIHR